MRICIATNSFYPAIGGIATYSYHLSNLLKSQGHEVFVIFSDADASISDDDIVIKEDGITKIILKKSYRELYNYYSKYFRPGGLDAPSYIATGIAMRDWLLKNQAVYQLEIIEVSDYGGLGCFLIDNSLPPVIITAHGSLVQYSNINHVKKDSHYKLLTQQEMLSFQNADSILPYSPLNQQKLTSLLNRDIDFATAPWVLADLSSKNISAEGAPLVIAGLQKIKGAEILAQALTLLKQQGHSIEVEWIGGDFYTAPPEGSSMAKYLKGNFSEIWGTSFLWKEEQPRDKTLESLAKSSFIIVPSIYETFSYVTLEAITMGKALIITDGTGASYLFKNRHDALLVPANNAAKLADAIFELHNDASLREKLGRNARQMLATVFDAKKITEERILLYKKIIATRKKHSTTFTNQINFLKKYITWPRRKYYYFRKFAKKIIKGV